jgi:diguanylate cyclase (GGDEF)-like protein
MHRRSGPWPRAASIGLLSWVLLVLAPWPATRAGAAPALDLAEVALTQYKLDGWQTEHGLPMSTVQSVHQSRDGTLWVGTGGGLARFDGIRFAPVDTPVAPSLASRPIFGFMEDADGWLWIGHSGGATRYRNGRYEAVFGNEVTDRRRVWTFAQAPDGAVWAATENGLVRWSTDRLQVFRTADGLPTHLIRSLAFDRHGTLWIGTTGGGLVRMAGGRFTTLAPPAFPHAEVRQVMADPEGGVWAATAGGGLVQVDAAGQVRRVYTVADGLPTEQLTALTRDATGALWIGTWGAGVARLSQGRFTRLGSDAGLGGDQVWSVHADREGSVWVGTWNGGLNRFSKRPFAVVGKPEGLASDNLRSVLRARDGSIWASASGGGVHHFAAGRVTLLTRQDGLPSDETSALHESRDGAIWIATYTAGLARLHEGRVERFGLAEGLPHVDVRVVFEDRAGTLWVGTRGGLARWEGGRFVAVREPGAPSEGVIAMLQDRAGTLWFGTTGQGLVSYRDGAFAALTRKDGLASNWIVSLHEDASGSLWIGTNGEGLNRLRHGRIATIGTREGLWDGLVQTIVEDRQGRFWMSCNRGIFHAARADLDAVADGRATRVESVGYGPGHALRSSTFAGGLQPAGALDDQGRVWLPSLRGLVIVDPTRLPGPGKPPAVRVEEVTVGSETAWPADAVDVPPGAAPLSLRYAAATVLNAERVRFRYRMQGVTPDWLEVGGNRTATFAALPHGQFRFQVAASYDGEQWRESEPLSVTVLPQLHQTTAFRAAAVLLLVAAAVWLTRLRTRRLRRRHAEMRRLVDEKTEALRLANEHLSRLSFTDALTGLANRRRLDEVLDTEWRRAARLNTPLALVLADIDAFKAYNDSLGHVEGDRCLAAVAEVVQQSAGRAGDFAARYGGEEFVLLLPGMDLAAARAHAESLRAAVQARGMPHPASAVAPVITLSLGVAALGHTADGSPADLLKAADAALYQAKQRGRNRVASEADLRPAGPDPVLAPGRP